MHHIQLAVGASCAFGEPRFLSGSERIGSVENRTSVSFAGCLGSKSLSCSAEREGAAGPRSVTSLLSRPPPGKGKRPTVSRARATKRVSRRGAHLELRTTTQLERKHNWKACFVVAQLNSSVLYTPAWHARRRSCRRRWTRSWPRWASWRMVLSLTRRPAAARTS